MGDFCFDIYASLAGITVLEILGFSYATNFAFLAVEFRLCGVVEYSTMKAWVFSEGYPTVDALFIDLKRDCLHANLNIF